MDWSGPILDPLRMLAERIVYVTPRVLGALLLLVVGWLLAYTVRQLIIGGLHVLRVDRLADKAGLSDALRRGAVPVTPVELIGQVAFWLIVIATVIVSLQFMGMTVAAEWLERFGYFIPRLIVSILVFLFGMLLASFFSSAVRATVLNAGMPHGHLIGQAVYTGIVLLTIIIALEQLEVVTRTIEVALYIFLGACGLAFALAMGLGAKDLVRQALQQLMDRWTPPEPPKHD